MNKVLVGKTVYDIVTVDGDAFGIVAGSSVKTLCKSNSITGWALWGRNPAGKITMSCPNKVVFF